jgi:hypothetical protein
MQRGRFLMRSRITAPCPQQKKGAAVSQMLALTGARPIGSVSGSRRTPATPAGSNPAFSSNITPLPLRSSKIGFLPNLQASIGFSYERYWKNQTGQSRDLVAKASCPDNFA